MATRYAGRMETFRREGVIRTKRSRLLALGLSLAMLLNGLHLEERLIQTMRPWMMILLIAAALLAGSIPPLLLALFPKVRRRTISVDGENVLVNGQPVLARSKLRDGRRYTKKGRVIACLQPRLRHGIFPHEIELPREGDVDAFLAAIRLDRTHRVTKVNVFLGESRRALLTSSLPVVVVLLVLTAIALVTRFPSWVYSPFAVPIFAVFVIPLLLLGNESVMLGSDGLLLRRSFLRKRFVPYAAVAHVETEGETVKLRLTDDEVIAMSFSLVRTGPEQAKDLATAIEVARREHATGRITEPTTAGLLGRNGRSAHEWMDALGRLVDHTSSYRDPALAAERLWTILEDPTASPTVRAGAAFALRRRIDVGGRERLRIATDACAAPKLRLALEATASLDDEALADALDALDDDAAPARARDEPRHLFEI